MKTLRQLVLLGLMFGAMSFMNPGSPKIESDSYWIKFSDDSLGCGYVNVKGDTMIPVGKYTMCWTDTFRSYAIVTDSTLGIIAINKQGRFLYQVFIFDNGPDHVSEGRFRIVKNGLIGFADERTGKVMIYPQYKCAFPYENSVADVSFDCEITKTESGEHKTWTGGNWYYIDHAGKIAPPPEH